MAYTSIVATTTAEKASQTKEFDPSKHLKINHERFLTGYIACGNATQAYRSIYSCTQASATSGAATLLTNPSVRARLNFLINNAPKTSAEGAIIKLGQRLESQRAVVVPAGGTVEFVDDNNAQINAATTLLKLHNRLKDGGVTINTQHNTFVAVQAAKADERLDKILGLLSGLRTDKVIDIAPLPA